MKIHRRPADFSNPAHRPIDVARRGIRDQDTSAKVSLEPDHASLGDPEAGGAGIATKGVGSTLNSSGERTFNLYDHLIVFDTDETTEQIGAAEVIDVRGVVANDQTFFQTVSDHLPIVTRFNTSGPDDD